MIKCSELADKIAAYLLPFEERLESYVDQQLLKKKPDEDGFNINITEDLNDMKIPLHLAERAVHSVAQKYRDHGWDATGLVKFTGTNSVSGSMIMKVPSSKAIVIKKSSKKEKGADKEADTNN